MKSVIVVVVASVLVWALIVPLFHLVPGAGRLYPVPASLLVAIAGGLIAYIILRILPKPPELQSSIGVVSLVAASAAGFFVLLTPHLMSAPSTGDIYCPTRQGQQAYYNSHELQRPDTNYLDPGESLAWYAHGNVGTYALIEFTPKLGCSGDSAFKNGARSFRIDVTSSGPSSQMSPAAKSIPSGSQCFSYQITCVGPFGGKIDPMIQIPRPPVMGDDH